ncbi:MAG: hypothetical protein R3336_02390, partial [Phycisphaeraceae bacterium]|nr:hypothetical protein [Phycisphaeraceae bacterium]
MSTADTLPLDQLDARIRAVWVREQILHLLGGLLALIRWLVPLFLAAVWIDWMTWMGAAGRAFMLLVLVGVSVGRAWVGGWRQLRPFDAVRTALRIESRRGDLQSLLVSALQLRRSTGGSGESQAMRHHTCRLAEEAAATLQPEEAVPYQPLRHPGLLALGALALIGIFAAVNAPFLGAGVARIFTPWVAIEYPTHTRITLEQTDLVIKEGDPATLTARIDGVVPERAQLYLKTGQSRARPIDLAITDGQCEYAIESASRDFSYRLFAGDDRTAWQTVRVIPSPRLAAVNVELTYPDYLQRDVETVEALTLNIPENTTVAWRLTLDRPLSAAQLLREGQPPVDLDISDDGRQVTLRQTVTASQGYNFLWEGKENGYRFTSPRYYLQVASDQAPRVEMTSPAGNMIAMPGRPLNITVRARDDHAIDTTRVIYRVNQHEDRVHTLDEPVRSGQGEQPIDWDYRRALPDLSIGDTVSFSVEVTDRYPGETGPHIARTETRRLTLLSEEQYLQQIEKQQDRLLSQVQTIYRQQRGAHQDVLDLAPDADGYTQACQLEAIRQEMIRNQLKTIAGQMQELVDDLAANDLADAGPSRTLQSVRTALLEIADTPIARAADLLRGQSDGWDQAADQLSPDPAARQVNTAARRLAELVQRRNIEAAHEVYAREAHMLGEAQARLRWHTVNGSTGDLAQRQEDLARWTERLIQQLRDHMQYDRRSLAVLRLVRSMKNLEEAGALSKMEQAAAHIRAGRADAAAGQQAELVRMLLNAEFSVRLSGAYSTLLKTRDQLRQLTAAQIKLQEATAAGGDRAGLAKRQADLHRRLLTLLLPTIPAPRPRLFDRAHPPAPPVKPLLEKAEGAMADARKQLAGDQLATAATHQKAAGEALAELTEIVDAWSVEMGLNTHGLGTLVAATSNRLSRIEGFEARLIALIEDTDIAAINEKKTDDLVEPQFILSEELAGFYQELTRQYEIDQNPDLPPLLTRLKQAEAAMNAAVGSLKDNAPDDAIDHQETAADALATAHAIVLAQNERLSLLQSLLMFRRSVGFASRYMADIVAEQHDLLAATRSVSDDNIDKLLKKFRHMRQCMEDVAPLLDLVAGRLDVGTPLAFARTDFEDAMYSLEDGDKLDAVDAQDVAVESLAEVQSRVAHIQVQTAYVAELVQFLHSATSDATWLAHQQAQLRADTRSADPNGLDRLAQRQAQLLTIARRYGRQLKTATGMDEFTEGSAQVQTAVGHLKAGDQSAAAESMQQAADAFTGNGESLFEIIKMLHGLPEIEIFSQTEPPLVRLIDVLVTASAQRELSRTTWATEAVSDLADQQRELAGRVQQLAADGPPHPVLTAASEHLQAAVTALEAADRDELLEHQQSADNRLRHFIVEQALILDTAIPPPSADPGQGGSGSDIEHAVSAGFISDFVSGE